MLEYARIDVSGGIDVNPLSANPIKWSIILMVNHIICQQKNFRILEFIFGKF